MAIEGMAARPSARMPGIRTLRPSSLVGDPGSSGTSMGSGGCRGPIGQPNAPGDTHECVETSPLRAIDGAAGWPKVESEGVDATWVVLHAAAAKQLEHVLLSWLTKGEPVERDVVLEPLQSRGIDAERVGEEVPLNAGGSRVHPVWRELTQP